jgi:adenine-specific DNA-methyltransferase
MEQTAYLFCKPRLDMVISGKDKGGITKSTGYEGGGGYKFYELAPTLVVNDAFGEPIINKKYSADMLASAVALHEGFTYSPDKEHFWKQSKASENSYLFVTTMHIDSPLLDKIANDMAKDEFLIIACKTFDEECSKLYKNIVIKKIPEMLLGKCEFGKDDYSLNIINPPTYEDEDEDEDNEK